MDLNAGANSHASALPPLSDGAKSGTMRPEGLEDPYAASASSSNQLADAEARFQAAKSRLLSLIRTSVDKVATGQFDSQTDNAQQDVAGSYANGSTAASGSAGGVSPSSGRQGDRGRVDSYPGQLSKQASASGRGPQHRWEQDKDLVNAMPLMQSVKPKSRQSIRRAASSKGGGVQGQGQGQGGRPASPGRSPFEISPSKVAKAAAHQKDFDLRLGPAYNLEMERMRRRMMVEERKRREEVSASFQRAGAGAGRTSDQQQQKEEEHATDMHEGGVASGRPSTMGATTRAGTSHGPGRGVAGRGGKPSTAAGVPGGGRRPMARATNSARPARGGETGSTEHGSGLDGAVGGSSRQGSLILPPVTSSDHPHSMHMGMGMGGQGQVIPSHAAINVNGVQMAGYVPGPSAYPSYALPPPGLGPAYAPMPMPMPYGGMGAGAGGMGGPPVLYGAYVMTPMGPVPAQYAAAYGGGGGGGPAAALSPRSASPTQPGSTSTSPGAGGQPPSAVGASGSVVNGMYGQPGGAYLSYQSMQPAPYYSYPPASASQFQLPPDAAAGSQGQGQGQGQGQHPSSPNGHGSAFAAPSHRGSTAGKAHKERESPEGAGGPAPPVSSPYGKLKPQLSRGSSSQGRGKSRGQGGQGQGGGAQKGGREGSPVATSPTAPRGAAGGESAYGPGASSPTAGPHMPMPGSMGTGGAGTGPGMPMPLYFAPYSPLPPPGGATGGVPQQSPAGAQPASSAGGGGPPLSQSYVSSTALLAQYGGGTPARASPSASLPGSYTTSGAGTPARASPAPASPGAGVGGSSSARSAASSTPPTVKPLALSTISSPSQNGPNGSGAGSSQASSPSPKAASALTRPASMAKVQPELTPVPAASAPASGRGAGAAQGAAASVVVEEEEGARQPGSARNAGTGSQQQEPGQGQGQEGEGEGEGGLPEMILSGEIEVLEQDDSAAPSTQPSARAAGTAGVAVGGSK